MNLSKGVKDCLFRLQGLIGWARSPSQVSLDLTHKCNLRCAFCFYFHDAVPAAGEGVSSAPVSWKVLVRQVIERLPTRDYFLTGGEPFIYPHLETLLIQLKEKRKRVYVSTNGTLIDEIWAEKIVRHGLFEKIDISLHGPEKIHDELSRVKGAFQKTVQGIEYLQHYKRKIGVARPMIGIACTISKENIPQMRELAALAQRWSLDTLTFGHMSFTTLPIIEKHKDFSKGTKMGEDFSLSELILGPPDHGLSKEDIGLYIRNLREIRQDFSSFFRLLPVPAYREEEIWRHYFDTEWAYLRRCRYPWRTLRVTPSGKVIPCLGVVVGDISEEGADHIWNNKSFRTFRKTLYQTGLFPGCARCCKLK
jgi:MoaA/NifB/PqqE/SkfB family radical SAM enzyme